jgi:hypothetical protein
LSQATALGHHRLQAIHPLGLPLGPAHGLGIVGLDGAIHGTCARAGEADPKTGGLNQQKKENPLIYLTNENEILQNFPKENEDFTGFPFPQQKWRF